MDLPSENLYILLVIHATICASVITVLGAYQSKDIQQDYKFYWTVSTELYYLCLGIIEKQNIFEIKIPVYFKYMHVAWWFL